MRKLNRHFKAAFTIWQRELLRFVRDRTRIVAFMGQPLLFLFIFGSGLAPAMSGLGGGALDFRKFLFSGIVGMVVLTTSIFSAVSIVWDREFGFFKEVMVAPVSRAAVVMGKVVGGATVATLQAIIVLLLAPAIGVSISPLNVVLLLSLALLLGVVLTSLGVLIAARMRSMEGFQMVMQFLLMPMLFLSGAFFPLTTAPTWIEWIARVNPLTYGVEMLRSTVLSGNVPPEVIESLRVHMLSTDILVIAGIGVLFLGAAIWVFQRQD